MTELTSQEEAERELAAAEEDVRGDRGEEALEAGFHDVVMDVARRCAPEVGRRFALSQLGFVPPELGGGAR